MQNKPKPRLFFNCPVKAAYMMKEFGVKYHTGGGDFCVITLDVMFDCVKEDHKGNWPNKWFIHPASEQIFLPKLNDVGITANGDTCHFDGQQWLVDAGKRYVVAEGVDIIFRGKQFFDCEREND